MKLPRPILWTMLLSSAAAVLVAAGWWWVTWPERAAQQFLRFLASDQVTCVRGMLEPCPEGTDHVMEELLDYRAHTPEGWFLKPWDRSLQDVALARQSFSAVAKDCERVGFGFEIEQGVVLDWTFVKGGGSH